MDEFLSNLDEDGKELLKDQIQRFKKLQSEPRKEIIPDETVTLPKGTLIHGTGFNENTLSSISKTGIITGQFFNIEEDGETYFCADFHKVPKEEPLEIYDREFTYRDGRCPFNGLGKNTLAFILYPDERMEEVSKYDCFIKDTEEGKKTRELVNVAGLPVDDSEVVSSVLFGIPSNFVNGIVLGDKVISIDNVQTIIKLFPSVFITRSNGNLLYKQGDNEEIIRMRVESAEKSIKIEELENEKYQLEKMVENEKRNNDKLWDSISMLPIESIAQIYEGIGWQGDYIKYAQNLKDSKQEKHI